MNLASVERDYIKIRNIEDYMDDLRVLWKEIEEDFHEQRLIMDCTPESLVTMLNQAKEFELLGPFRVSLDTGSLPKYRWDVFIVLCIPLELVLYSFGYP